jgi:hypothetical protein
MNIIRAKTLNFMEQVSYYKYSVASKKFHKIQKKYLKVFWEYKKEEKSFSYKGNFEQELDKEINLFINSLNGESKKVKSEEFEDRENCAVRKNIKD